MKVFEVSTRMLSLSSVMTEDSDSILVDTSNTFIHTSGRTIAAVGVEDLIIVDDDNATLIARKGQTEKVKTVIGLLKDIGNASATEHSFEYRPWGMPQGRYSKLCSVADALPMSFSRPMTVFTFSV